MVAVGITADRRWEEQAELFRRRGIDVIHGPTMRTLDLSHDRALRAATEALMEAPPLVLVATTGAGMRQWFEAADGWGVRADLLSALAQAVIVARGAKSSSAVRQAGLEVSWRAPGESMAEVLEHVRALPDVGTARIAVQLFDPDDHPATAALRAMAGEVVEVPIYRWLLPDDLAPAERLVAEAVSGSLAAVTFTSQPAVRFFFRIASRLRQADALCSAFCDRGVLAACIGPVCAEALFAEGVAPSAVAWPEPFRLPPMVRMVAARLGVDDDPAD